MPDTLSRTRAAPALDLPPPYRLVASTRFPSHVGTLVVETWKTGS